MKKYNILKLFAFILVISLMGCTKLNEKLNSTLTNQQTAAALGANGVQLLLKAAYNDLGTPFTGQSLVLDLEENSADDCVVPTRGGDWDDNGDWRATHQHTWNADRSHILDVFNGLNKLNFDATNVLGFSPTPSQAAQARFLRAYALYHLLDLYGKFPVRNPGDNLLNAPDVKSGADAAAFLATELTAAIADLPASGGPSIATKNAGKALLMKVLLNKGAFANRATPSFADADMAQVVSLGNEIINGGTYSYAANYFDNFSNNNSSSTESIFAYPYTNGTGPSSNPYGGISIRWMMTLHYNSYNGAAPNAGWNGFSTVADFYNSFGVNTATTGAANYATIGAGTNPDTIIDGRLGGRIYKGTTDKSGLRPGFLIGQQRDENGVNQKDRKGAPLIFNPNIAADLKETGSDLEVKGIRGLKYVPDFSNGVTSFTGQFAGSNWLQLIRYADVVLMVAEAKMRLTAPDNAGALALVNGLRTARNASSMASITLVNTANVSDPNTLLAERGRELWWESVRRTDLIRFGMFLKPWAYKTADDPKYLLYPIPNQALSANPNLTQNPGY
jgi:hypothetical protein